VDSTALRAVIGECNSLYKTIPQEWWFTFPGRKALPPTLLPEAARLMERLLSWPGAVVEPLSLEEGLYSSWTQALRNVFQIQTNLIEADFTETFRILDSILARLGPPDAAPWETHRAQVVAGLNHWSLRRWIAREPDILVPRLLELEKNWIAQPGSPLPEWWLHMRSELAESLYIDTLPPDPASGTTSYQTLGERWCREYLSAATAPMDRRAWLSIKLGVGLLSVGRADDAATMMDLARNAPEGESLDGDVRWLRARFFVAQMGHGDRALARTYLDKMEALVSAGKIKPDDGQYRSALQNYNAYFTSSDAVLKQRAQEMQAENRRNSPPLQKEKSTIKPR